MILQTSDIPTIARRISGNVIARNVAFDDFMAGYEGMHVEWVEGVVIEMPSINERHDALQYFLRSVVTILLELTTGGRVLQDPMIMRVVGISSRAPDLQVLLLNSLHKLKRNIVIGAADLVVEIVSEGSQNTDRSDKLSEYARAGVPEYWIIDPIFKEALFYILNANGEYERIAPVDGIYTSKMLPQLKLPVAVLWQEILPNMAETMALVKGMLTPS